MCIHREPTFCLYLVGNLFQIARNLFERLLPYAVQPTFKQCLLFFVLLQVAFDLFIFQQHLI